MQTDWIAHTRRQWGCISKQPPATGYEHMCIGGGASAQQPPVAPLRSYGNLHGDLVHLWRLARMLLWKSKHGRTDPSAN